MPVHPSVCQLSTILEPATYRISGNVAENWSGHVSVLLSFAGISNPAGRPIVLGTGKENALARSLPSPCQDRRGIRPVTTSPSERRLPRVSVAQGQSRGCMSNKPSSSAQSAACSTAFWAISSLTTGCILLTVHILGCSTISQSLTLFAVALFIEVT